MDTPKRSAESGAVRRPLRVCVTCGRVRRIYSRGECGACAVYRRDRGAPRPYGPADGRTVRGHATPPPPPIPSLPGDPPDTRRLPLTKGQTALVDEADHAWLSRWKWKLVSRSGEQTSYAGRSVRVGGQRRYVLLHRAILGLTFGDGVVTDHRNRDGLDNRRANLRVTDPSGNGHNRRPEGYGASGALGVQAGDPTKDGRRWWRATLQVRGRTFSLGHYATVEAAAAARRRGIEALEAGGTKAVRALARRHPGASSGVPGVHLDPSRERRWKAVLRIGGRAVQLGRYATVEEAAAALEQAKGAH